MAENELAVVAATVAMAAADRLIGLRGGRGDCSELGLGGGDGARARLSGLSVLSWLLALMITVERREGGTGGGGAFASLLEESMATEYECVWACGRVR